MPTTRWSKGLLILIAVALPFVIAYLLNRSKQRMPECPHDWDFSKIRVRDSAEKLVTLKTVNGSPLLSGPGLQTNVPEFNDCQRLIVGSGETARYDSLYAVFARESLDDTLAIRTRIDTGVVVPKDKTRIDTGAAVPMVKTGTTLPMVQTRVDTGTAFPMVEILSLGGTYSKLALKPGFNCLFVFEQGKKWYARMVAFGPDERDCHSPKPVSALPSYHELSIKRTSALDMRVEWQDIPAVARWEWDVRRNAQVIGFKCLDGWCEVGELGPEPETGPDLTSTMSGIAGLKGSPVLKVKGWYDEQRLSPTKTGWWRPGAGPLSVVGTIVPVPGLDQLDSKNFAQTWQLIAYVNLSAPSSDYSSKQGFVPMASAASVTTIWFCMEDWGGPNPLTTGGCPDISVADRNAAKCGPERATTSQPATTIHWWAKTIPAGSTAPRYWCIVRRSAPKGVPVPGTARWRWLADDETTWGRCGGACCAGH